MHIKRKLPPIRVARLGSAKRLTRGIFGPYLEVNGNPQDMA